jgi:hypothetical protein
MFKPFIAALAFGAATCVSIAQTAAPAAPPVRLRGTIEKIDATTLTMKERSGEVITLTMVDNIPVSEVKPIALSDIKAGSYIGSAAMPQADGTQLALEVLVFPEAARGSGEGHYPWDLQPKSTMTNATVADLAAAADGQKLTLRYKDGEKILIVPANVPVVTFAPGDKSLLVPGAKVMVTAQVRDGKPTAMRVLAGRNGFTPPM